ESGDPADVRGFPGPDPRDDAAVCLGCHAASHGLGAWTAGEHARAGLSCIDCHDPHAGWDRQPAAARLGTRPRSAMRERCFGCHPEVRAEIRLPSRHPMDDGQLDCASCHDVHGTYPGLLRTAGRVKDLCVECHPAQEGPFVFQHAPVEEDCTICHRPHGAVADGLLAQTQPFLCLQCHEAHFHAGLASPTETTVTFGTVPPNTWANPFGELGMKHAFLTRCTQCHVAVHGSDSPSQGVSGRGGNLTR
ncbi:MAG: ammonia-forming cytochrome c nitrite reductase subunit c552, partial [Acidobacteria bacterium]